MLEGLTCSRSVWNKGRGCIPQVVIIECACEKYLVNNKGLFFGIHGYRKSRYGRFVVCQGCMGQVIGCQSELKVCKNYSVVGVMLHYFLVKVYQHTSCLYNWCIALLLQGPT